MHLITTLIFLGVSQVAQAAVETPVSAAELNEKLTFYRQIDRLEADFRQVKDLHEMGMQMKSEGRLTLLAGESVVWEVLKPSRVKVELDPSGIQVTRGEGTGKTVEKITSADMPKGADGSSLRDLIQWLRMDAKILSAQYTVTRTTKDHFIFTPKTPGPFSRLEMDLPGRGYLRKLILRETSGDQMTLEFSAPRIKKSKPSKPGKAAA